MFFNEFEKYKDAKLDKRLLWEYDINDDFEWQGMRHVVVQRVIEMGKIKDFYAIFNIYDGIENVKKIIEEIDFLSKKDMNFVSIIFNIKKESLKCYTKMLSQKKPIFY